MRTIVMAVLVLAGCAPGMGPFLAGPTPLLAQPALRTAPAIEDSDFERTVTIRGVQTRYDDDPFNDFFIRSWVDKSTGVATHQLYVDNYYKDDWRFWTRANDQSATPMEFVEISSDVIFCGTHTGCTLKESFGISIPDKVLRNQNARGYSVKVYARDGSEMILTIPPNAIAAQLDAVNSVQARVKR